MSVRNLAAFNKECAAFSATLLPKQFVAFQMKLGMQLLSRIVKGTPVDTGYARGNWQTSLDSFPEGAIDRKDKSGRETIAAGQRVISGLNKIGQVIYITNNVPYILPLENGHSGQAPAGMVAITFAELRSMFG